MKDRFNVMLLPVIGLVLVVVLTYGPTNSYINDLFGGGSEKAECAVCTKVTYNGYFTNWTVSHLLLFVVLGYMFPNYSTLLIVAGIFWEFVEMYFDLVSHNYEDSALCQYLLECSKSFEHVNTFWKHYGGKKETNKSLYWSSGGLVGSLLDILADILGVYVGVYLAHCVASR
jgi:hypothetical protein